MDIRKKLGKNVKNIRRQNGYTIETLSGEAGIAFSTLSLIERGQSNPSIDILEKISNALGTPISKLFEFEYDAFAAQDPGRIQHPFKYQEQINKLAPAERKKVNTIVDTILTLIDSADNRGKDDNTNSGL